MSAGLNDIQSAVKAVNDAMLDQRTIQNEGQGMAFQMAAHSAGLAVQDAGDYLRNFEVLANAASGRLLAEFVATQDMSLLEGVGAIIALVGEAAVVYAGVTTAAANAARSFPSGE